MTKRKLPLPGEDATKYYCKNCKLYFALDWVKSDQCILPDEFNTKCPNCGKFKSVIELMHRINVQYWEIKIPKRRRLGHDDSN